MTPVTQSTLVHSCVDPTPRIDRFISRPIAEVQRHVESKRESLKARIATLLRLPNPLPGDWYL